MDYLEKEEKGKKGGKTFRRHGITKRRRKAETAEK